MHRAKVRQVWGAPWVPGGPQDKQGHGLRQGGNRTPRATAEHPPSHQSPCSGARRLEDPQSLHSP